LRSPDRARLKLPVACASGTHPARIAVKGAQVWHRLHPDKSSVALRLRSLERRIGFSRAACTSAI